MMIDQALLDQLVAAKRRYESTVKEADRARITLDDASRAHLEAYQDFQAAKEAVVDAA